MYGSELFKTTLQVWIPAPIKLTELIFWKKQQLFSTQTWNVDKVPGEVTDGLTEEEEDGCSKPWEY